MTGAGRTAPAGPMLEDIRRQPEVAAGLLARSAELQAFAAEHLRPGAGGRLYLFGSGDGWFAARAAAAFAGQGAHEVRPSSTLPFLLETAPGLGAQDRVLAISMSGDVDRTLEAAEAALDRGAGVALLTKGTGGRVGALGIPRLSLGLPEIAPFLCGTATYTASLLALGLLLDAGAAVTLAGLPEALAQTEERSETSIADWIGRFTGVRLLALGTALATADYGAAKLVEVTRTPAWTDDLEEFAHRQFWTADPGELVVLLPPTAAAAGYADATAGALRSMAFTVAVLETEGVRVPNATLRLRLPDAPGRAWPVLAAVPLQLLAWHLARATGLDPNTRAHLRNDERRFRTSRLLTRRSLLGTGR
jgi:fructoselysine-6-P-deglycase FrlB-like protein